MNDDELVVYRLREAADRVEGLVVEYERLRVERDDLRRKVDAVLALCDRNAELIRTFGGDWEAAVLYRAALDTP